MDQEPATISYENAQETERRLRRRTRRRRRWIVFTTAFLVLAYVAWPTLEWAARSKWRQIQFARLADKPATTWFPPGTLSYAFPTDFKSRSTPVPLAAFGQASQRSADAATAYNDLSGYSSPRTPALFLGSLAKQNGSPVLVMLRVGGTAVWDSDAFGLQPGYYVSFGVDIYDPEGQSSIGGGGYPGVRLAPLDFLPWNPEWDDLMPGQPVPLSFYGSRVSPADASVAEIFIELGDHRGVVRFDLTQKVDARWSVTWDGWPEGVAMTTTAN